MRYLAATIIFVAVLLAVVIAYYSPVLDRLFVRPCHYYPEAFKNCKKEVI